MRFRAGWWRRRFESHSSENQSRFTGRRNCFFKERLDLSARIRSLAPRLRPLFRLLSFSIRARSWAAACLRPASILSSNSRRARMRFCPCCRVVWHFTCTPVGRCNSITQVAVLLTFWPPCPPERTNVSTISASNTPSAAIRRAI